MPDPIPYDLDMEVADVVDLTFASNISIYWSASLKRSRDYPDVAMWSGVGVESLLESRISDGDLASTAFTWLTGAGDSYVVLDLGAGNDAEYRECRWSYDTSGAALVAPSFDYSDDGAAWTSVAGTTAHGSTTVDAGGGIESRVTRWDAPGAHRYWRAARDSGTDATAFTEIFFREYGDLATDVEAYAVINMLNGGPELYSIIDADDLPTVDAPLSIEPIYRAATFELPSAAFDIVVKALARNTRYGRFESDGVRRGSFTPTNLNRATYVVQDEAVITGLTNGLNSDVNIYDIARGPCSVVVNATSGVSGAYSVGGFYHNSAYTGGERFRWWNWTAHTLTFVNQSGSSTAANRIKVLAGADVNIVGNGYGDFEYSGDQARFIFIGGRDSAGYK